MTDRDRRSTEADWVDTTAGAHDTGETGAETDALRDGVGRAPLPGTGTETAGLEESDLGGGVRVGDAQAAGAGLGGTRGSSPGNAGG